MGEEDTFNINDFNFEDEELKDIEYLEIMNIEDIIKENPTFIAFTEEEIYNELYNLFKDKNKTYGYIDLYYNIINDRQKKIDTNNYIIYIDAEKKDYSSADLSNMIDTLKKYNKSPYNMSQNEKDKFFYVLNYDEQSNKIRFKAENKTYVELRNKYYALKYAVFKNDNTNIPINSIYYLVPRTSIYDYLNAKIIAQYYSTEKINEINANEYTSIRKLFKAVKPDIPLDKIENNYLLDYDNIEALFQKYNISLDSISIKNLQKLKELLVSYTSNEKDVYKPIYKGIKIKPIELYDSKLSFYKKISNIVKQVELTTEFTDKHNELYLKLIEERANTPPKLLYNNIFDIINSINTSTISLEDIAENIKGVKKTLILDYAIETLQKYKDNNIENITYLLDKIDKQFEILKNSINEVNDMKFVNFYEELLEIKEGNNIDDYQGVPLNQKNIVFDEEIVDFNDDIIDYDQLNKPIENIEKYWLSTTFKNDIGFIEHLKIILQFIDIIRDKSKLPLNYELLCNELFKYYRDLPTKFNLIKKNINNTAILNDNDIDVFSKLTPLILKNNNTGLEQNIYNILILSNKEFSSNLIDMLYKSIMWWSIQIQIEILDKTFMFNNSDLYISCLNEWSEYGSPLEKNKKEGVLYYLICIIDYIYIDLKENNKNLYFELEDKIFNTIKEKIEVDYADILKNIRDKYKNIEKIEKQERGIIAQKTLVETYNKKRFERLLIDYIDALIYMPGVKYKKVHKFLLGCCLEKIDNNYKADAYLSLERKDLYAAKIKFGTKREIYKERESHYLPYKQLDYDIKEFSTIKINEISINLNNGNTYEDWLISMKNINPLLPNDIIEILLENTKKIIDGDYIEGYLKLLSNTAGIKKSDISSFFNIENLNYKNILLRISKILNKAIIEVSSDNDNEKKLLSESIKSINNILENLKALNILMNYENRIAILRIRAYITVRSLCLPASPENSNRGTLTASIEVNNKFMNTISKYIYTEIYNFLKTNTMPTLKENVDFINKIREMNKNETLKIMNTKTQDERDVISQIKKIINKMDIKKYINDDNNDNNDEELPKINEEIIKDDDYYDNEGEDDFNIDNGDYMDENPDNLERDDYDFIKS